MVRFSALDRHQCPGAVVEVVHRGRVVFRRAYGYRSIQPMKTPMTADTVFDLASLTKPLATATAAMILVEQGKLRLADPVAHYWPEFGGHRKARITVEQLLLHTSGLLPDNPVSDYQHGKAQAFEHIAALAPEWPPGTRFRYSDVNYIVLGHLIARISGETLDAFAPAHLSTTGLAGNYLPAWSGPAVARGADGETPPAAGSWARSTIRGLPCSVVSQATPAFFPLPTIWQYWRRRFSRAVPTEANAS